MAAQVAAVVLDRRALTLHDALEVVDVGAAGLADRAALGSGDDDLGGDPPAQFRLSLCAGEPVARASATLGPEAPLDAPAADAPGAVVGLAPVAVGTNEQLPGAVGALTHAGNYVACMGGAEGRNWNHIGTMADRRSGPETTKGPALQGLSE